MSSTWVIYLLVGDNISKGVLIPHKSTSVGKGGLSLEAIAKDEPAAHQLVGRVKAYQGDDG